MGGVALGEERQSFTSVAPDPNPIDSWSTAAQYAVTAFGLASRARSKMDVRRGIDRLNLVLQEIASSDIGGHPVLRGNFTGYLSLISAAVALDLAHFEVAPQAETEILAAVGSVALLLRLHPASGCEICRFETRPPSQIAVHASFK